MRILLVSRTYWPSLDGTAEVVRTLAEHFARTGHEVHVVTGTRPGETSGMEEINGVKVHTMCISGSLMTSLTGRIDEYQSFVLNNPWDIIHIHGGQTWTIDAVLSIAGEIESKLIFTPHASPSFGHPEWSAYYESLFENLAANFSCTTILSAKNPLVFGLLQYGIHHVVIGNGVNVEAIQANDYSVRDRWGFSESPWVVNVGNHTPVKGHNNIYHLAHLNKEINFSIIGNSYPAEKFNLGRYGVQGGCYYSCALAGQLIPNLFMHQHLKRDEVIAAIRQSDIFILPSTTEAFPLVILEAMSAGTPWIGFDVGNLRELDGGIVVSDRQSMQAALVRLLDDPAERRLLGDRGIRFVKLHHDWPIILKQYEELYYK